MRIPLRCWGCWLVVLLLWGCGGDGTTTGDVPPADSTTDLGRADAAPADSAMDAMDTAPEASQDTGTDAIPDTAADTADTAEAPFRCALDGDCRGRPEGEVCDAGSGRCVPCLPSRDSCGPGRYCDATLGRCADGCADDRGCAGGGPDGGAAPRRCDVPRHTCVDCVTDEHCPPGTLCVGTVCVVGCTATRPCPAGQSCCGGACVDPLENVAHCGGCDRRCAVPNAVSACRNGTCAVATCSAGFGDCDGMGGNGCETDTRATVAHCGGCGAACRARPHTSIACAAGACGYTCEAGFADCDGAPDNGCETDTRAAVAHCGGCGRRCDLPNATATCVAGACAVDACAAGFGDCDRNASNGCEVDTRTAVSHCGTCGTACPTRPNALAGCAVGVCAAVCVAGFAECNGDPADGCETALATSVAHCGACGRACAAPRAEEVACRASACAVVRCAAGFADCDGMAANGCEVNLALDPRNCGACGRAARPEVCDGADNDCDGLVDEDVAGLRSNVPAREGAETLVALRVTASVTIQTDTGEITGLRAPGEGLVSGIGFRRVPQAGGPTLGVFDVAGFSVAEGVTVTVLGAAPLVVLSTGRCQLDGVLDASGADGTAGAAETSPRPGGVGRAGGGNGGDGSPDGRDAATAGTGAGGGGRPVAAYHYGNGGGGGGFGGGGGGGATDACGADGSASGGGLGANGPYGDRGGHGGGVYGTATLVPLVAGSGGGGGTIDTDNGPADGAASGGGAGGGAVQLTCAEELVVGAAGALRVTGGSGGPSRSGGGGGGSGGAALLQACRVQVLGSVLAHGGRGGNGYTHLGTPAGGGSRGGIDRTPGGGRGCNLSGGGGGGEGRVRIDVGASGAATLTGVVRPAPSVAP